MSANPKLPLNEPQERRLTAAFATLEKQLQALRERLEHGPRDLRLNHYDNPLGVHEAEALLPVITEAENRLRRMADELALGALTEPVRWAFVTGLELASINLYDCRAEAGLRGYGKVAPATADYLECEIPKLDAVIQSLLRLLQSAPPTQKSNQP
jgi:hypothetical protein